MYKSLTTILACLVILAGQAWAGEGACDKALELGRKGRSLHNISDRRSLERARDIYLEALELCPELCRSTPQVCANLGNAYYHLGQPEEAIRLYKQALRYNPDYGTPYFGLGEVYLNMGLLGFALDAFLKAYLTDRSDVESRTLAAKVFAKICERNKEAGGDRAEDVVKQGWDRRKLEDKLLMDKSFSETNRRLFYCEQRSARVEFNLRNITFERAKAVLEKGAYRQIDILGLILKDNPDIKVILEGHTDSTPFGRRKVKVAPGRVCSDNLCLSEARADAVKQALVERFQLDPDRIKVEAYGDTRPLDPGKTKKAKARNRRVTLVLDRGED